MGSESTHVYLSCTGRGTHHFPLLWPKHPFFFINFADMMVNPYPIRYVNSNMLWYPTLHNIERSGSDWGHSLSLVPILPSFQCLIILVLPQNVNNKIGGKECCHLIYKCRGRTSSHEEVIFAPAQRCFLSKWPVLSGSGGEKREHKIAVHLQK